MWTPRKHAKCGPSGAHRWLNCTAAPTFEEQFPDEGSSIYARQGTLAHSFCELMVGYNAGLFTKRQYNARLKKLQAEELYNPEMIRTAEFYAQYIWEKVNSFKEKPYQAQEVKVDISDYVPEGFGSCDSLVIGSGQLHITDYKHGVGTPVSAENNPQMRLYALGALKQYGMFYPIETVTMAIVQPRVTEDVQEETITKDELLAWGEQIKPIAEKAFTGVGAEFREGTWCKFCKGRDVCRARAQNMTALEDFKDIPIEGKMPEEKRAEREAAASMGFEVPPVLSDTEIADLLIRGESLVAWYNDIRDYALNAILSGKEIPGWKCVEGRSARQFDDPDAALEDIKKAGYEEAILYERKPKSLAVLEKMMGKKQFGDIVGARVVKPVGKPTLVRESDKRAPFSAAAADFKGAVT